MTGSVVRRLFVLTVNLSAVAVLGLGQLTYASTPYFKVFGGDVWSGGWFTQNNSCSTDSASNYQDPQFTKAPTYLANNGYGGIFTDAKTNSSGALVGASTQYAAYSLGLVDNDTSLHGFYSSANTPSTGATGTSALTFANNDPNHAWGGAFQYSLSGGTQVRQSHCIPDYYSKLPASTTVLSSGLSGSPSTDVYSATATTTPFEVTSGAVTVARGSQVTLYVNGPAIIDQNITYDLDTANDIPKFTLVVQGPLYIAPNVSQLDGVYISQPKSTDAIDSANGVIWTCHPNDTSNSLQGIWINANCGNQLTINGALIAKQVNFLRIKGDIDSAGANENSSSTNIAEIINYTPEMVIGGPFFNQQPSASLQIRYLVSLPPVF